MYAPRLNQKFSRSPTRRSAYGTRSAARDNRRTANGPLQRALGNQGCRELVQTKLRIGHPRDPLEAEADRIAERVVRMPDQATATPLSEMTPGLVQRMCTTCSEEDERVQTYSLGAAAERLWSTEIVQTQEEEEEELQTKRDAGATPLPQRPATEEDLLRPKLETGSALPWARGPDRRAGILPRGVQAEIRAVRGHGTPLPASAAAGKNGSALVGDRQRPHLKYVEQTLSSPGRALEPPVREQMETRFGHAFGSVRIHTDEPAARSARELHAAAYTVGDHIVFGHGRYRPHEAVGARVLAHELTHVLQQRAAGKATSYPQRVAAIRASQPAEVAEREADRVAASVFAGPLIGTRYPVRRIVTPAPLGLYRAIATYCLAPSELPSISAQQASEFGKIAEIPIVQDYCLATGGCAWMATDYMDTDAASYIAFLAANNPSLTTSDIIELAVAATVTGGVSRPDVLTHKPPRFEFEEIKPDSITGRAAGRIKLAALATLFARFYLPYLPGTTWSGTGRLPLFVLPGGVEIFLQWHRNLPGLVVYNICVRGEASVLAAYGVLAILIAAILIILTRGRILRGAPRPFPIPAFASAGEPAPFQAPGTPETPTPTPVAESGLA